MSRKMLKRLFYLSITLLVIVFMSRSNRTLPTNQAQPASTLTPTNQATPSAETVKVTRVIDGDTIEVSTGSTLVKVRYLGIDTPETVDPKKPVQCFGKEASNKNKELVENKQVRLEKDVSETDQYGRLLRYVYVDNIFVNDYLVRQGFAHISTFPPDVKYQEQFLQAEREARENGRGLWAKGICGK